MLFTIALERVIRGMAEDRKMNIGELDVLLAYADDIVSIGNSRDDDKQTTQKFMESSKMMGLEVNQQKTKYMGISRTEMDNSNLKVDNFTFEKVN